MIMTASRSLPTLTVASLVALAGSIVLAQSQPAKPSGQGDGFKFRTGVELINVTATVTDATGRFVSGLKQEDFVVYEDDVRQEVTHFSAERVPVSLGLVIDTSGSMAGEKWEHATEALDRFLLDLLVEQDEVFLYRFSNDPILVEDWTIDRARLSHAMQRLVPRGGTAMYDALAEAVPLADTGHNRKKAVVVISDGNDTNSRTSVPELKQLIRESEVMIYAVGIDGDDRFTTNGPYSRPPVQIPIPWPTPGGRRRPWPGQPPSGPYGGGGRSGSYQNDHVNAAALRELTDDTGGRTEIVRSSRDLDPATTNIADELSKQYFLAYPTNAHKDGQWHTIRVEVRDGRYHVRARRGYMAS
jgi:VWFA-related protein